MNYRIWRVLDILFIMLLASGLYLPKLHILNKFLAYVFSEFVNFIQTTLHFILCRKDMLLRVNIGYYEFFHRLKQKEIEEMQLQMNINLGKIYEFSEQTFIMLNCATKNGKIIAKKQPVKIITQFKIICTAPLEMEFINGEIKLEKMHDHKK